MPDPSQFSPVLPRRRRSGRHATPPRFVPHQRAPGARCARRTGTSRPARPWPSPRWTNPVRARSKSTANQPLGATPSFSEWASTSSSSASPKALPAGRPRSRSAASIFIRAPWKPLEDDSIVFANLIDEGSELELMKLGDMAGATRRFFEEELPRRVQNPSAALLFPLHGTRLVRAHHGRDRRARRDVQERSALRPGSTSSSRFTRVSRSTPRSRCSPSGRTTSEKMRSVLLIGSPADTELAAAELAKSLPDVTLMKAANEGEIERALDGKPDAVVLALGDIALDFGAAQKIWRARGFALPCVVLARERRRASALESCLGGRRRLRERRSAGSPRARARAGAQPPRRPPARFRGRPDGLFEAIVDACRSCSS